MDIYSKSVKQLSEKEKVWVLLNNNYKDVKDEYGNTVYRYKSCIEDLTILIKMMMVRLSKNNKRKKSLYLQSKTCKKKTYGNR